MVSASREEREEGCMDLIFRNCMVRFFLLDEGGWG